jgi:two-component system, CitB family, sensor kinase
VRVRPSLAGQLLILQLVVVLLVVLAVAVLTVVQADAAFRRTEGRRVLSTAESIAATQVVENGLVDNSGLGIPGEAERTRSFSTASYVIVTDENGEVVYSPRPEDRGDTVVRPGPGQWVGESPRPTEPAVEARVPVIAASEGDGPQVGTTVGYVLVGREYPSLWQRLGQAAPALTTYVGVALLVGIGGSILLSRRIKRQTLGLEPGEITGLVEHREAMLHGLREGVVGVDSGGRVTLVNDEAVHLLPLGAAPVGARVANLDLPEKITAVISGAEPASDLAVVVDGRVLVVNQMPVEVRGQKAGSVTTLRDRTELVDLNRQLDLWRGTTDALRSQAHEFSNRMHTVAGLIELGEYADAAQFVASDSRARAGWTDQVTAHVQDAAVAALLVAKGSRASERGVHLDLTPDSRLPSLDEALSADVLTVVGNLVDNAVEAVSTETGEVGVSLRVDGDVVEVQVRDNGCGISDQAAGQVFEQGYSTKGAGDPGARGWGLALSRVVCRRRGGDITLHRAAESSTVFTARVPLVPHGPRAEPAR